MYWLIVESILDNILNFTPSYENLGAGINVNASSGPGINYVGMAKSVEALKNKYVVKGGRWGIIGRGAAYIGWRRMSSTERGKGRDSRGEDEQP